MMASTTCTHTNPLQPLSTCTRRCVVYASWDRQQWTECGESWIYLLDGVGVGEEVDDLESVLHDADGHDLRRESDST